MDVTQWRRCSGRVSSFFRFVCGASAVFRALAEVLAVGGVAARREHEGAAGRAVVVAWLRELCE